MCPSCSAAAAQQCRALTQEAALPWAAGKITGPSPERREPSATWLALMPPRLHKGGAATSAVSAMLVLFLPALRELQPAWCAWPHRRCGTDSQPFTVGTPLSHPGMPASHSPCSHACVTSLHSLHGVIHAPMRPVVPPARQPLHLVAVPPQEPAAGAGGRAAASMCTFRRSALAPCCSPAP